MLSLHQSTDHFICNTSYFCAKYTKMLYITDIATLFSLGAGMHSLSHTHTHILADKKVARDWLNHNNSCSCLTTAVLASSHPCSLCTGRGSLLAVSESMCLVCTRHTKHYSYITQHGALRGLCCSYNVLHRGCQQVRGTDILNGPIKICFKCGSLCLFLLGL